MKRKILSAAVGAAGLVAAYFIASGISNMIYQRPAESESTQTVSETEETGQGTEEAKAAMTEDEINEMLVGMKSTETAATEETAEEPKAVIPVKFTELQQVNPDVYAWITVPVRRLIIRYCSMHLTIPIISCTISTVLTDIPAVSTPRI